MKQASEEKRQKLGTYLPWTKKLRKQFAFDSFLGAEPIPSMAPQSLKFSLLLNGSLPRYRESKAYNNLMFKKSWKERLKAKVTQLPLKLLVSKNLYKRNINTRNKQASYQVTTKLLSKNYNKET